MERRDRKKISTTNRAEARCGGGGGYMMVRADGGCENVWASSN